jgi:hypothetical protein
MMGDQRNPGTMCIRYIMHALVIISNVSGCCVANVYGSPHVITKCDDQVNETGKPSKLDAVVKLEEGTSTHP